MSKRRKKEKSLKELDGYCERLRRQIEVAKLEKELKKTVKGGKE